MVRFFSDSNDYLQKIFFHFQAAPVLRAFSYDGISRRYYELCLLSERKNSLRSGDIWVQGSRQFKYFSEYLLPLSRFIEMKGAAQLGLAINCDCEEYLDERLRVLSQQLDILEQLAAQDKLPEATIGSSGLRI